MKLPLIYNPKSGPDEKRPEALLTKLPKYMRDQIEPTPFGPPWDYAPLIEQAKAAEGPLVVWGGDGTLHHAGRALVDTGCPVPLAAIPGGSGNGLVRGLRTPLDPAKALLRLLQGRELRMDLPRLDGVPFLNVCGTGFEAVVARAFDTKPGRGFWNYVRLSLGLWRQHPEFTLAWDGEPSEIEGLPETAWSLCFANLPQYGSGLWISPSADPTDGLLHWVRLRRPGPLDFVGQVRQLFQERGNSTLRQEGSILRAVLKLDEVMPWHMDGEPAASRDRAEITLESKAFRIQVTTGCPWV